MNTVESHINESHIKDKSHINDVQAAYQLLLYVLGSSHIKDKSHINDVFAADAQRFWAISRVKKMYPTNPIVHMKGMISESLWTKFEKNRSG